MGNSKAGKVFVGIFLAVLLFFMTTIMLRFFTRQVLVQRLGVSNAFTSLVFFDVDNLNSLPETDLQNTDDAKTPAIDWAELYPFPASDSLESGTTDLSSQPESSSLIRKIASKITTSIGRYTRDYLVGYQRIVELAKGYEQVVQWDFAHDGSVIFMSDGHLTYVYSPLDTGEQADAVVEFERFCKEAGAQFLYLQAPFKVCKVYDLDISGQLDFCNQNADAFLSAVEQNGVDTLDFREVLHGEGLNHHALFYRTDHHWRAETGLWAARHILHELRERYELETDPDALDPEKFDSVLYPRWFLGSQGKKATLARTEPEDFSLLYPNYPTSLHYEIKSKGIDCDGDFSVLYDMEQVNKIDYYKKKPYAAYIYGDRPLECIENHLQQNGTRVLIIHDSFGDCVVPFLAMGVQYVDSLDLRYFTGSVETFIRETKPDFVLVLYNPGMLSNEQGFDFR